MLDIGFRPDIERILRRVPDPHQTLLLSATIGPDIRKLAQRYMYQPVELNLSKDEPSVETIQQFYITVEHDRKFELLVHLLDRDQPRQCIVFTRTKRGADKLAERLRGRVQGVATIHGDLAQTVRNRVMQGFRDGTIPVLVATDVVGRGIDVNDISHVINYDIPDDAENYLHRIGRTGRMGKDGIAYMFVCPDQGEPLTAIENSDQQDDPGRDARRIRGVPPRGPRQGRVPRDLQHREHPLALRRPLASRPRRSILMSEDESAVRFRSRVSPVFRCRCLGEAAFDRNASRIRGPGCLSRFLPLPADPLLPQFLEEPDRLGGQGPGRGMVVPELGPVALGDEPDGPRGEVGAPGGLLDRPPRLVGGQRAGGRVDRDLEVTAQRRTAVRATSGTSAGWARSLATRGCDPPRRPSPAEPGLESSPDQHGHDDHPDGGDGPPSAARDQPGGEGGASP